MKITKKDRNNIIGLVVGSGHISKSGVVTVFHCYKQKEYSEYKFSLVKHLCDHKELLTQRGRTGDIQYGFRLKTTNFTKALRRALYPKGKKVLTRKLLNRLSTEHLAIWWMDGGHCSMEYYKDTGVIKSSVSTLSTCVSKEDNQVIIDWFLERHGVRFGQRKMKNWYALVCRLKEGRKLANVIGDFVIDSMKYKLSK